MTLSDNRLKSAKQTVLVVNSNADVLVLMRGILQKEYRVLLATDAESAVRLLTIHGVRIDLTVVDHNVRSSPGGSLQRRMAELVPQMRMLTMAGVVEDEAIRLQRPGASNKRRSYSLLQKIHIELAAQKSGRTIMAGRVARNQSATDAQPTLEVTHAATSKVMCVARF